MLSMVFSSSVFAAEKEQSAWDSFVGLFAAKAPAAESEVGVEYRGHIQNVGNYPLDGTWVQGPAELGTEGKGLRLEGFWIKLNGEVPADTHIQYQVHVQNVGWMDPVQDGAFAGTEGKSLQIEAIKIKLVDDNGDLVKDYSVVYSGHVQNVGDVGPFTNGEKLGTEGSFLRLEAIEVEIVQNKADLTAYEEALAAVKEADYTPASWAAYQEVVEANVVTEDSLQSEVDAATAAIVEAQKDLVELGEVVGIVAINATTVEVTFADDVTEVDKAEFAIDGLAVTNAAIKQSNSKIVVLTTAAQEGAKVYGLTYQGVDTGLTFTGISAVLPTAISLEQGTNFVVVGQEFTVKATVTTTDANKAGIPVTFNIKSPAGSLNQNIIEERLTNADGVAEYTYTRYATDDDTIAVYPTGAASVRATRVLSWTAQDRLAVTTSDVNVIANDSNKTYTVTVRNQDTGAVVAGQQVKVLFSENVAAVNGSSASVTDPSTGTTVVAPAQRATGNNTALVLTTNTNGTATFTVTGANTKATPIIYMESLGGQANRLDAQDIQVWGAQVTFQGVQLTNQITVTPDTDANIANSTTSGRVYTVEVKKADGTAFAGGRVQIGFNELVDNNLGTATAGRFIWFDNDSSLRTSGTTGATLPSGVRAAATAPWNNGIVNQMEIALNADGKATFQVADNTPADVATPIVWIDLDNTQTGLNNHTLEATEPSKLGGRMIIEGQVVTSGKLEVDNSTLSAGQTAVLTYSVRDQNGAAFLPLVDPAAAPTTGNVRVTYSIANTGTNPLTVTPVAADSVLAGSWSINGGANGAFPGLTLNAGTNATVAVTLENSSLTARSTQTLLGLTTAAGAGTSYSVSAQGLTLGTNISLPTATVTGNFVNAVNVDTIAGTVTGTITAFTTADADYMAAGAGNEQSGRVIVSVDGQPNTFAWFTYTTGRTNAGIGTSARDNLFVGNDSSFTNNTAVTNDGFERALSVGNRVQINRVTGAHRTDINNISLYNVNGTNDVTQINNTLPLVVGVAGNLVVTQGSPAGAANVQATGSITYGTPLTEVTGVAAIGTLGGTITANDTVTVGTTTLTASAATTWADLTALIDALPDVSATMIGAAPGTGVTITADAAGASTIAFASAPGGAGHITNDAAGGFLPGGITAVAPTTVTVDGTTFTRTTVYDGTSTFTTQAQLTTLINNLPNVDAVVNGGNIDITAAAGVAGSNGNNIAVGTTNDLTAVAPTSVVGGFTTLQGGIDAVSGVTERGTYTVTTGSAAAGTIQVVVNGISYPVNIAASSTPAAVATAIQAQLPAIPGYVVTNPSAGVVVFTSNIINTNIIPDITVVIPAN